MKSFRIITEVYEEFIDDMIRGYAPYIDETGNIRVFNKLPKLDVLLDDFDTLMYFNSCNVNLLEPSVMDYVNECKAKIESTYQDIKKTRKTWRRIKVKGVIYGKLYNIIYRFMSRCGCHME